MSIEVGASLIPGTANTPLDARCRVTQISDIPNISNPFLGMEIFCIANSKTYKVTKLKSKMIGSMSVANGAVDEYEEIPDATALAALEKRVEDLEGGEGSTAGNNSGSGMLVIEDANALPEVKNPVVGQHIFLSDPGKEIIVTSVTEGKISTTEDVPTRREITSLAERITELEKQDSGTDDYSTRLTSLEEQMATLTTNMETASASIDATIGVE